MSPALSVLGRAALVALLAFAAAACPSFHPQRIEGGAADQRFVTVDGVDLRVLDQGPPDAPVVVLVHGFASALDAWYPVTPALTGRYRVISMDLKGFGFSARPEGDYSPAAHAALVLGLMDQLGVDKAAVVAHSWGSSIALAMALRAPERVTRLALYSAWVYEEQLPSFFRWARNDPFGEALFALYYDERADERMARAFYDPTLIDEAFFEVIEKVLALPGTTAAAQAAARDQDFERLAPLYKQVRQPTLLLWGREDHVSPLPFAERLVADLPHADLRVYPRCGHFPMVEAYAASTRDLVTFLGAEETR